MRTAKVSSSRYGVCHGIVQSSAASDSMELETKICSESEKAIRRPVWGHFTPDYF